MEERHKRLLLKQNPWWESKVLEVPAYERDILSDLLGYEEKKQILAVTGLRRVGKTVVLKQIIKKLLVNSPAKNVCYVSFDDLDFQNYETAWEVVNYFLDYSDEAVMRYLFMDEIQKITGFPDLLKTLYDTEKNLKIFVSGSASLDMRGYKETLAGRIMSFHLSVLSFREYARYFGLKSVVGWSDITKEYDTYFLPKKSRYEELFHDYLTRGAFPELLEEHDEEYIKRYIRESVIEKTVRDVSRIAKAPENVVYELLRMLSASSGRTYETVNLADNLKTNRNLVAGYIDLLEKTFLIKICHNYSANVSKQVRTAKKAYAAHPSIIIALLDMPFTSLFEGQIAGQLVETAVANNMEDVNFWRTPQKDEIDLIQRKQRLPIEIKYSTEIRGKDRKALIKFCEKYKCNKAVIATKDQMKTEKIKDLEIIQIPAWLLLLVKDGQTGLQGTPAKP